MCYLRVCPRAGLPKGRGLLTVRKPVEGRGRWGTGGHCDLLEIAALELQLEVLFREVNALAPSTPFALLSPLAEESGQMFAESGCMFCLGAALASNWRACFLCHR